MAGHRAFASPAMPPRATSDERENKRRFKEPTQDLTVPPSASQSRCNDTIKLSDIE